ncbi:MAG: type IV pilus twitching motility protein PilT [Planctomycetota bacterium]
MPEIDKLLRMANEIGASDLHISVGAPPILRLHGVLRRTKHPPFSAEQTKKLIMDFLTPDQKKRFQETKELDLCYELSDIGRFRTNVLYQRKGIDASFRVIPSQVRTIDELGLPSVTKTLLAYRQGLILVTGAAGTGKTTTLAAMIDYLNQTRRDHIITVEDPIEIIHTSKGCHVTQREVGPHTNSFGIALRAALREDPDIILVGEMRDLETMSMAITSAETGHLVLATLHTSSAPRTINRVLDVFPPRQQPMIRAMVSESLRGILCQQLVPRADGQGRVLALEICVVTPAISNLIREQKAFQITSQMQIGQHLGMQLLDDHLESLLKTGFIARQEAYERANEKKRFMG